MKVSLSGKQFVFPRSCACCGAYPTTSLPVTGTERNKRALTKGWSFDIPYCLRCREHILATDKALIAGLIVVGAGIGACFVVAALRTHAQLGFELGALLVLATGALGVAGHKLLCRKLGVNCTGLTRSVIYLGSEGHCHSFDIRSAFYATDFIRSNHRKIVNASTRVASILTNTSHGAHQVGRRLTRRQLRS